MPTSDLQVGTGPGKPARVTATPPLPKYELTFVASPNLLFSIAQQIRAWLREPKITLDKKYYRGEARLPIVEMRPWYRDLHRQLRLLFETPNDPIGFFNRRQEARRVLVGLAFALAAAAAVGWLIFRGAETEGLGLVIVVGLGLAYGSGYGMGALLFKKRAYPPDIWRDYQMQPASWVNSLLVHAVAIIAMLLPFLLSRVVRPLNASSRNVVSIDISPYLSDLAAAEKKAGGGGGGGDRSPTPASKGAIPKFSKTQLAPPMVVIPNPKPVLPVQPTLLGPPDLKLPQMQAKNIPWGDPQGVVGPASNGPGFGGGIGTGSGGGIGSGEGAGLGPGSGGGTGGGPYAVGGNVSAPIPIYQPMPAYSEEARKAKHQGTVVLWIVVNSDGSVSDVRVVKPLGLGLDEKAVETVKTWKFKPGMRNGAPVPVLMSVEVLFRLL
jgi:TonB family protein